MLAKETTGQINDKAIALFDIEVGDRLYRRVAVHGSGGPIRDDADALRRALRRASAGEVIVYTHIAADGCVSFVLRSEIQSLRKAVL